MTDAEQLQALEAYDKASTDAERLRALQSLDHAASKAKTVDVGNMLLTGGKSLLRGAATAYTGMMEGAARANNVDRGTVEFDANGKPLISSAPDTGTALTDKVMEALPVNPKETAGERGIRYLLEGAGGMAVPGGGMSRAPLTAALTGGLSRVAGGFAADATHKAFPQSEVAPQISALLAGYPVGMATAHTAGRFSGLTQNPAMRDLRLQSPPEGSPLWQEIQDNLGTLQRSGVPNYTLADAAPQNSGLRTLANQARGQRGGEAIRDVLDPRLRDLTALRDKVVGPPLDAADVAARAAATSDQALGNLRGYRSTLYSRPFSWGGDQVSPSVMEQIAAGLQRQLGATPRMGESRLMNDAFSAATEALTSPTPAMVQPPAIPQPPTRVMINGKPAGWEPTPPIIPPQVPTPQGKSSILAAADELKQIPKQTNPLTATGGKQLDKFAANSAYNAADAGLREASPAYGQAQDSFAAISQGLVDPATRGPLGIMSGRAFSDNVPIPVTRLNGMYSGVLPAQIERIQRGLGQVGAGIPANNNPNLPAEIARTIVQNKLKDGSLDLGKTLRGQPGSRAEAELGAIYQGAGLDAPGLLDQLKASDLLQGFAGAPGNAAREPPVAGLLVRPLRAIDVSLSLMSERSRQVAIAEILRDPARFAELQKIAAFDPTIRKSMAAVAGFENLAEPRK